MDNSRSLPGYKYYVDPADESRPAVFVTFLNLVPADEGEVNGVCFPVEPAELAGLDDRERNYERVEVTGAVRELPHARVWTYVGTPAARDRYRRGARAGRAVVSREYYEGVCRHAAELGPEALDEFRRSTDPPACPIVDLARRDLP